MTHKLSSIPFVLLILPLLLALRSLSRSLYLLFPQFLTMKLWNWVIFGVQIIDLYVCFAVFTAIIQVHLIIDLLFYFDYDAVIFEIWRTGLLFRWGNNVRNWICDGFNWISGRWTWLRIMPDSGKFRGLLESSNNKTTITVRWNIGKWNVPLTVSISQSSMFIFLVVLLDCMNSCI